MNSDKIPPLPEYVGALWIAERIGTTRQNVTKTALAMSESGYRGKEKRFARPDALFEGRPLWLKSKFEDLT